MNIVTFTLTVDNNNNQNILQVKYMTLYASNKVKYTLK
jgi:hypothetical protein